MKNSRLVVSCAFLAMALTLTLSGCGLFGNATGSFTINTQANYSPVSCPTGCSMASFPIRADVYGSVDFPLAPSAEYTDGNGFYNGWTIILPLQTAGSAFYFANGTIVDTNWSHNVWFNSYCSTPPGARWINTQGFQNDFEVDGIFMEPLSQYTWVCDTNVVPPGNASFSQFAVVGTVPSSITLPEIPGGGPFSVASGPPLLEIISGANGAPSLYSSTTATSVDPSGDSATFALPNPMPQGMYALVASNQNPDGTYSTNAYNVLTVANSQTIAGNPFGVAAGGMTTTTSELIHEGPRWVGPFTSITYRAVPVVSLYSAGQVLIGSVPVTVGTNPTAVTAYAGTSSRTTQTLGDEQITTTVSGTTLAIVANSGSNTISVLNLLNGTLVTTITVGNQPVALAVDSAGANAYVANYADGTVSQVNLSTNSLTTTVAAGGQPTSVAITSGGVLWVGGAGFLTEINTQTMTTVATQSTGKTLVALSYSDLANRLIATTADIGGRVYVDEVNPATVQTGSPYSPAASQVVSSLGSYLNRSTGAMEHAFTATPVNFSITNPFNPVQIGAPPLVVQDGWAVVSATPTGFTISDATGGNVILSETTSAPVAGIAVDPDLSVAYLTMPDSNTVLTVPLPGVGAN